MLGISSIGCCYKGDSVMHVTFILSYPFQAWPMMLWVYGKTLQTLWALFSYMCNSKSVEN